MERVAGIGLGVMGAPIARRLLAAAARSPLGTARRNGARRCGGRCCGRGKSGGRSNHATGFVIAQCDSSVPGKEEGVHEDETLAWLEDVLARTSADVPVLIGFHHPSAQLHIPFTDGIRQFGAERLTALADRHPNLAAFLCGHAHTAAATIVAGRPLLVAPGVVSTLRLLWEHSAHPQNYVHLDQPPALAFHVMDGERRLTSHSRCVNG